MSDLDAFYVHTAAVSTYQGSGAYGPVYADPVNIPCMIDSVDTLVTTTAGQQVSQRTSMLYADTQYESLLKAASRVQSDQLGDDQTATITKVNPLQIPGLSLPDHVECELT